MVDINGLRQQRAKLYEQLKALQAAADGENRALTAEESKQFDDLETQINALDARIKTAERAQALRAETAIPAPAPAPAVQTERTPNGDAAVLDVAGDIRADAPGIAAARMIRAVTVARGDLARAHAFATQAFGERDRATLELGAAMQSNDFSSGGALVPERFTAELIPLLRPKTVIRRNARNRPLIGGSDSQPAAKSGTTASYVGESDDTATSEAAFTNVRFTERNMRVLVPVSNKLIRNASLAVDAMIRDMLVQDIATGEDLYMLRGDGVGPRVKGIRYQASTILTANGTINLTNIEADARAMELALLNANVPIASARWIMSPRTFTYLRDLRDGNGNLVFPALSQTNPMWKGYPVEMTTQAPSNLGVGSNEAELYLVAFDFAWIADAFTIRIDASESASYKVGNTMVSAFSTDQTLIRAIVGHDFQMSRPEAAAVLTAVKWGA